MFLQSCDGFYLFLGFIVFVELFGRYFRKVLHQPNAWVYNFSIPVEYLFYWFIFFIHFVNKVNKKITIAFSVCFFAYVLTSLLFIKGLYSFNNNFLLIGSLLTLVLSILFFIEMYQADHDFSLLRIPMFWIASGVLLFNAGEFTSDLLSEFFINKDNDAVLNLFYLINNRLILVLYSCFIVAFLCEKIYGTYKRV